MENVNVFDMYCDAIEEYNGYTDRKDVTNLSYREKRGLFYNCLRRKLGPLGNYWKRHSSLLAEDLNCAFDEKGKITSLLIDRGFSTNSWLDDESRRVQTLIAFKDIARKMPVVYPMRSLNELSLIVNSIK